jgi:ubiquitin C-terminal hydrolase
MHCTPYTVHRTIHSLFWGGATSLTFFSSSQGQEMIYDLRGVINHFGGSGFGHYTAYCHSPGDNQWHLFDDSNVTRASLEDVCGPAAYVLFYRKRV